MSVYYNFILIDLNKYKAPPLDESGQIDFTSYEDIEDISIGKTESALVNYTASEMIDLLYDSEILEEKQKEIYATFFGNLFWSGNSFFNLNKHLYYKNAWGLENQNGYQEFYSINKDSIERIISLENDIDFNLIKDLFDKKRDSKKRFSISFKEFYEHTQNWLALYKLALLNNSGIAYDIN